MRNKTKKELGFRVWFYFRQGWSVYFAFVFAAINTLVVTYYLAIEKAPFLQQIFPTFLSYALVLVSLGIPILTTVGYIHMKRSGIFKTEVDIGMEVNPHMKRLLLNTEEILQHQLFLTDILIKSTNNEKLNEDDISKIKKIRHELQNYTNDKTMKK